jgi:hypothetical protein
MNKKMELLGLIDDFQDLEWEHAMDDEHDKYAEFDDQYAFGDKKGLKLA